MNTMYQEFKNPSVINRPAPLWVWNDTMEEKVIYNQLLEMKNHGFGGAFVHPRPGLITEYLSEEWFAAWKYALDSAKELGLKLYIYDENSYPSGFAGGHVPSKLPNCISQGVGYSVEDFPLENPPRGKGTVPTQTRLYLCEEKNGKVVLTHDVTLVPYEEWDVTGKMLFRITVNQAKPSGWLADFANIDHTRPEVMKELLNSTYEAYYQHFHEDFGDTIPAIFTDEPAIYGASVQFNGKDVAVPFSYYIANEFEQRNGYSLIEHLPLVLSDVEGDIFKYPATKVRFDYYNTIHELWTENDVSVAGKWCEDHNIAYTGHYLEHQWPFANSGHTSPCVQSNYEYHQWPAIDMLLSNLLRDTPTNNLMLTIQELRSAVNQFGKERSLCELYGAGGWDSTFEDYKRMGDWVMVNGVNFINQHLTYSSIAGTRKRDHPQSFDWREPWWDQYTQMNDYLGRACGILSSGKMEQRILLLNPTTTGFLVAHEDEEGNLFRDVPVANPPMGDFIATLQYLTDEQWDFDLGDEYTMQRHAEVYGKQLAIKKQNYDVVIVPGDMQNMLSSTVALLQACEENGVAVVSLGAPGNYVEGVEKPEVYAAHASGSKNLATLDELGNFLDTAIGKRIESTNGWLQGVSHMRRVMEDGIEAIFFVNHHLGTFETTLTLKGSSVESWDLFSSEKEGIHYQTKDGKVTFDLKLDRNQSVMLVLNTGAESTAPVQSKNLIPVSLVTEEIQRESGNLLMNEYCDFHVAGKTYQDMHVIAATDLMFRARGYDGNPWDNKVQFRNTIMDTNNFEKGSGFTCGYKFYVEKGFRPEKLQVIYEQRVLVHLQINGTDILPIEGETPLDHLNGVCDIAAYVQDGENVVSVIADRFDVRLEIEAIFLRGTFSVDANGDQWILRPERALDYGPWTSQGQPFYGNAVNYRYQVTLDNQPQTAIFAAPECETTCMSLLVNGKDAGLVGADGKNEKEISAHLRQGENEIVLRVCGSLKNLLGPHHAASNLRGTAWPAMWRSAPRFKQPAPDQYDLIDYGLITPAVLSVEE